MSLFANEYKADQEGVLKKNKQKKKNIQLKKGSIPSIDNKRIPLVSFIVVMRDDVCMHHVPLCTHVSSI